MVDPRLTKSANGNLKPIPGPREEAGIIAIDLFTCIFLNFLWFLGELGLGDYIIRFLLNTVRLDVPPEQESWFEKNVIRTLGPVKPPYEPIEGDIYICSYAKCGFHWMGQAALQIAWRGRMDFDHIHQLVPWIEFPGNHTLPAQPENPIRSPDGLQIIKTHLKREYLPISPKAKYIVIARDPCDAVVSGYPFLKGMFDGILKGNLSPDQWLKSYLDNNFIMGSWAQHLAGFWNIRDQPNVLFLNFADIKKDTPGTIDQMSKFMGVVLTEEEKALVLERSSVAYMKEHGDAFRNVMPRLRKNAFISPTIRKGKVGGANELYSKEQLAAIEKFSREELKRLGSDVPYDELFHSSTVKKKA